MTIPLLALASALTVVGVDQFTNLGTALAAWLGVVIVLFRPIKKVTHGGRQLLKATQDNTAAVRDLTASNKDLGTQVADLSNRVTALEHAQDRSNNG